MSARQRIAASRADVMRGGAVGEDGARAHAAGEAAEANATPPESSPATAVRGRAAEAGAAIRAAGAGAATRAAAAGVVASTDAVRCRNFPAA